MSPAISLSRNSVIAIVLVAALAGGGVWWSWTQVREAGKAERRLRMQQAHWRALAASDPVPVVAVAAELSRRVETAETIVAELRQQLGVTRNDAVARDTVPPSRADAYFALAQFMERQARTARQAEVGLPDNPAFGFSAHRNSGPADEHRTFVHRQMLVLDQLLTALWTTQPEELVRVQRENPWIQIPPTAGLSRRAEGDPADWLGWPESRSLRSSGIVDTLALRIGWIGRTATLRAWLRQLRDLAVPVVVREVTVEPVEAWQAGGGRRSLADLFRDESETDLRGEESLGGAVPLIADNTALFWVTVEYLDLTGEGGIGPGLETEEDFE